MNHTNNHKAKSYTGIYSMHKYWSKKPYNVVRDFILNYSKENNIVLDPFCGSGVSLSESIFNKRKAIGIDINPSAIFISRQLVKKVSGEKLKEAFEKLERSCKNKIGAYYLVKRKGKQYTATHFIWTNGKMTEVWYKNKAIKTISKPTSEDTKLANSFCYKDIPYFYPKKRFIHNSRINANKSKYIYELFTPRNLKALSFLFHEIGKIKDKTIRDTMKFCFTASVGQTSRMVFVIKRRGKNSSNKSIAQKKEVGSWVIGYWVPKEHFEINVWNCFENRFKRILKAKNAQEKKEYILKEAKKFSDLIDNKANLLLFERSAIDVLRYIPDNSIDFVITDPPHGNRIPYLELSMLWNGWLKKDAKFQKEVVISDSPERKKDIKNYYFLLNKVFSEIDRILKPRRHFSLIFNSLDDATWIYLFKHISKYRLKLSQIDTMSYSAGSVVQDNRAGGLKTDFIFTFIKTPNKSRGPIKLISTANNKKLLTKKIDGYIKSSGNGLKYYEIINMLMSDLLAKNKIIKLSEIINLIKARYRIKDKRWITI